jgi:hypothetical protein
MFNYGIGGQERKSDNASEGITDIPLNRTLLIEKLTADAPFKPEIVEGLKTVDDVFLHFQPQVEVEFDTEDGASLNEVLSFQSLSHFGKQGIVNQSTYLQGLTAEVSDYQRLIKQLKSNKIFKAVLENPDAKAAYIAALKALAAELDEAEQG